MEVLAGKADRPACEAPDRGPPSWPAACRAPDLGTANEPARKSAPPRIDEMASSALERVDPQPFRLFVLGATGGTGRALLEQARQRGHLVTAFVRSPEKLDPPRDGLTVLRGDPRNADKLRAALPGHDGLLSALGPPGLGPNTLVSDCARSTVAAMQATGVRRLLVVGVAVLFEDEGLLSAIARRAFLRNVARDTPRWSAS